MTARATISGEPQPRLGPSMIAEVRLASMTMTSTWPTGSRRRGRGARDSGTKRAVSAIAARPMGMFTRNTARQLSPTSTPPRTGPSAMLMPDDGAPDPDRLRPLARILERVADDRHRHRVEHRAGGALEHAEGDQPADARREAAGQRRGGEQREAELEHAGAAQAIRGRPAQHEQAREHHGVGGGRPLQRRDRRTEVAPDRRQRDVDDRHVHPHDQQAHAADREHEPGPDAASPGPLPPPSPC